MLQKIGTDILFYFGVSTFFCVNVFFIFSMEK